MNLNERDSQDIAILLLIHQDVVAALPTCPHEIPNAMYAEFKINPQRVLVFRLATNCRLCGRPALAAAQPAIVRAVLAHKLELLQLGIALHPDIERPAP